MFLKRLLRRPKYLLKKNKKNEWFFVLVAPNGKTILQSESYKRKSDALKGINAVKKYAKARVVEE